MERKEGSTARKRPGAPRTALMGQRLWRQAESDFAVAQTLLRPDSYYVAANLAHQAAEKAVKAAYWHLRAEEPAWTHSIGDCAELVAEPAGGLPPAVDLAIEQLDPMFIVSRYPSSQVDEPIPVELVGEQDALAALRSAEEVMAWVRTLLQLPPGRASRKRS